MQRCSLTLLGAAAVVLTASQVASAADLGPVRTAPPQAPVAYIPPPPPPFSWTGFYIGGNAGVAWTEGDVTDSFGNSFGNSQRAVFAGGGQVGANYQINWLVLGVEADFDWLANNNNSSNTFSFGGDAFQLSANDRWMTTVAGRAGVAVNNWLIYAKGGGGWVGVNNPTLTDVTTGSSISLSGNNNSGWLAGGGVEYAFAPNWTARLEYVGLRLNDKNFTVPAGALAGDVINTGNRGVNIVTVGVNYLFNWR
jgi:outer membrane immunogenic protein